MCFWCYAVQVIRYHLKLTLTMMCRNHTTPGTIIFMKRKFCGTSKDRSRYELTTGSISSSVSEGTNAGFSYSSLNVEGSIATILFAAMLGPLPAIQALFHNIPRTRAP